MQRSRTRNEGRGLLFGLVFAASALVAVPALAGAQDKVYAAEELTTKPKVESMARTAQLVQRSYPDKLKAAGVDGTVQVQFVIGTDGKVDPSSIEIVAATVPALGEAAKAVAAKLEFQPGKVNDSPVRTRVLLPIVYKAR
ncbi:MAG: energy transducer TonB [Gemmatimonadaceae bacterium]